MRFSCGHTHWYAFTAPSSGSFTVRTSWGWPVVGLYRGSSLGSLTELDCRSGGGSYLTFGANAGQVTYIQITDVYNGNNGPITTTIENAPAPVASFWSSPWDPSSYDLVSFSDNSYDPGGNAITSRRFDFGDGSSSTTGCCPQHRYLTDGDYTVTLTVTTSDGRTASVQQVVHVLTHDVAITKITLPQSASAGQSRELSVALKNTRYGESVTIVFYRSRVGGGWDQVGSQTQSVPARSGKTTTFSALYTFTADDKAVGKVTFKAVAMINGARDALPADNEVVALRRRSTERGSEKGPAAAGPSLVLGQPRPKEIRMAAFVLVPPRPRTACRTRRADWGSSLVARPRRCTPRHPSGWATASPLSPKATGRSTRPRRGSSSTWTVSPRRWSQTCSRRRACPSARPISPEFPSGLPAGWHDFTGRWYDGGRLILSSRAAIQFVEP